MKKKEYRSKHFLVKTTPTLYDKIKAKSVEQDVSLNEMVNQLMAKECRKNGKRNKDRPEQV